MTYRQVQAFVSSRMKELRDERRAVKRALEGMSVLAWVYEDDAEAQEGSPHDTYSEALRSSDLLIGLYGEGYGRYTEEEYELAHDHGIECKLYFKDVSQPRDPALDKFLQRIGGGVHSPETVVRFGSVDDSELLRRFLRCPDFPCP